MIKLYDLLLEIQTNSPKAIFLAGAAGAGKSYISKQLIPSTFETINSDDTYEALLKASNIGLKQKDFTPDQLSTAAKLQSQARKISADKFTKSSQNKNNLVIDGTGAASGPILKKKKELEDLGYETFMVMIYVSPLTSLERNKQRDRSLMPGIVIRTWSSVNKNIPVYTQAFGNNFVIINNDPSSVNKSFSKDLLEPYLSDSTAIGKPKSPEEQAKRNAEKEALNKEIETQVKHLPKFDSIESAKSKTKSFING